MKTRALRGALQAVARLAARVHDRRADDERQHDPARRASCSARSRRCRGDRSRPRPRWPASRSTTRRAAAAAEAAVSEAKPMSGNAYKVQIARTAVKRAILQAAGIPTVWSRMRAMDHLTSPKLTPGVHCLNLRHKGIAVTSGPDAGRVHVLRQVRLDGVLVRGNAARIRARRRSGQARLLLGRARLLQALTVDTSFALHQRAWHGTTPPTRKALRLTASAERTYARHLEQHGRDRRVIQISAPFATSAFTSCVRYRGPRHRDAVG